MKRWAALATVFLVWLGLGTATAPLHADPSGQAALRRVDVMFISEGRVIANPSVLVGGGECQTFAHHADGGPPTLMLTECASKDEQLRVSWAINDGVRQMSNEVTGSFAPGSTFDAGIPDRISVVVSVGESEAYLDE